MANFEKKLQRKFYIMWKIVPPVLWEGNSALVTKLYQWDKLKQHLIDRIDVINKEKSYWSHRKVDGPVMYIN